MADRPLTKFRELCQALLDEGIKPTPGELAKRGYGKPSRGRSGPELPSGQYTRVRREVLAANGWTRVGEGTMRESDPGEKWQPPEGWLPKEAR